MSSERIERQKGIARGILSGISLLLLAAPWWSRSVETVNGRSLFVAADSMMTLGLGILFSLLCEKIFPDQILNLAGKVSKFFERRIFVFGPLFIFGTVVSLYWVNRCILHSFMNSADEHSCYFLAECLRLGKLFVKPHPLSEFFNVVHVGNRDGKWFSVYPPGWPLILALGLQWGVKDWLNPVLCALSLVFFFQAGKKVYGLTAAWLGIVLMTLSPFFMFTSASYFSHGTCLLAISVFLYAFLKWREKHSEGKGIVWAGLAAFALGYGLNTRYLTMAAVALPFLAYYVFLLVQKRIRWNQSDTVFVAILTVMMSLVFTHNYLISGKIFKAPNRYDKGWERLGFHSDYTPMDAVIFIFARFFNLADWFPPTLTVLYLFSVFQSQHREPLKRLFQFGVFYLVFAYAFYYSWGGNQYGPRYYFEGLPFLALSLGERLQYGWRKGNWAARKFLLGVLIASIVTSGYLFYKQARFFDVASAERKALYEFSEKTLERPAIVFIKGFLGDLQVMAEEDAVRNSPSLNGKILYAHDLGEKNQALKAYYPDREYYRGTFDRVKKQAKLEKL